MIETGFYIGLMSGTSLDGIDAALVCFSDGKPSTLATHYIPYPEDVRREALALQSSGPDELHRTALLSNRLMHLHAEGVKALLADAQLSPDRITAQGCHGQTLRHRPESGYTLQISNPALLAELTGIAVVSDFRSRDVAAGGQGAPLVPAAHAALFQSTEYHRLILNIGGIANITNLPLQGDTTGFDCGPGNMLLDGWASRHLGLPYDANGAWGQSGNVIPGLLEKMLAHPFLDLTPPKSCGREQFGLPWLDGILTGTEAAADVQRCLLELTARSAADAVRKWCGQPEMIYVCGGGTRNGALMSALATALPGTGIGITDQLGVPADWVEAVAFAWLARQHMLDQPGNLPKATGSRGPRVLGAYYPA